MARPVSGALIVTAELGAPDLHWLDAQRRAYFPPERNVLPAHLTMFHALPPSAEQEARRALAAVARQSAPRATIAGLMNLGGGVAYRVISDDLDALRADIAARFHGLLSAQDGQGWRPHVTIQNKVSTRAAKSLFDELSAGFTVRPLTIAGLALHRYLGGPWENLGRWSFRR